MFEKESEPFSNPLAPPSNDLSDAHHNKKQTEHHPLTNADFRKLLMTPRVVPGGQSERAGGMTVRASERGPRTKAVLKEELIENRKKKKKFYATGKKYEDDTLAELAKKYRDRAKERREEASTDYNDQLLAAQTAAYRAVAPDFKSGIDAAERRKQMIQESKYLGGDMEHTHLVKGLDYALLQKVRSEIQNKEREEQEIKQTEEEEEEEEEEKKVEREEKKPKKHLPDVPEVPMETGDPYAVRSLFAQSILRYAKPQYPERNELFLPGRMAYHVELEDEFVESDIPTTVIRSKAECPNLDSINTLSTNDIVINKLIQIIAYLRQGGGSKKKKAKEKEKEKEKEKTSSNHHSSSHKDDKNAKSSKHQAKGDSIYDDVDDYVPDLKRRDNRERERERDRHRDYDYKHKDYKDYKDRRDYKEKDAKTSSYFDKKEDDNKNDFERDSQMITSMAIRGSSSLHTEAKDLRGKMSSRLDQEAPDSYAECYPGAPENDDAVLDSDDEVDYAKMDLGNKKGLIGRWDFDTAEEYGDYMAKKEALPKAAFQYGVKMSDGRKTRRVQGKKDEKMKLDRDLQKINALIAKRKAEAAEGGGVVSFNTSINDHKKHKSH